MPELLRLHYAHLTRPGFGGKATLTHFVPQAKAVSKEPPNWREFSAA